MDACIFYSANTSSQTNIAPEKSASFLSQYLLIQQNTAMYAEHMHVTHENMFISNAK